MSVRLETRRYLLRTLDENDATERYLSWMRDPEVMRYLHARFETHSLDSIRRYIAGHDNRTSFLIGVFCKESGLHVGNYSARCNPHHKTVEQGVLIGDRAHWGRGAVLETRAAVLDFLFDVQGMEKVCGNVYADNVASLFNYKAQGWRHEGTLVSHVKSGEGRCDVLCFAISRDEWRARR